MVPCKNKILEKMEKLTYRETDLSEVRARYWWILG